jgi:hypothetical protein
MVFIDFVVSNHVHCLDCSNAMTTRKKKPAKDPLDAVRKKYPGNWEILASLDFTGEWVYYIKDEKGEDILGCSDARLAIAICKMVNKSRD